MAKTLNLRVPVYRKLQQIKMHRRWSFVDTVDILADRELAAIESECAAGVSGPTVAETLARAARGPGAAAGQNDPSAVA